MQNLGQVAALLYGTTAPENRTLIWARTDNDDPETWKVTDFRIYDHNTTTWEVIARTGSLIHTGSGVPSSGLGTHLDVYLDTTSLNLYKKNGSTWGSPVANMASATPSVSGVLLAANNLSDLSDPAAARETLDVLSSSEVDALLAEKALKNYPVIEITELPHTLPPEHANCILHCQPTEPGDIALDESAFQFPVGTEVIVVNHSEFTMGFQDSEALIIPPTGRTLTMDQGVAILRKVKVVDEGEDLWVLSGDLKIE
jgi:hypothetical protein